MNVFAALALLAALAAVISLISGITAMVSNGEVAHRSSAEWMNWRVAFQAIALVCVAVAITASSPA